MKLNILGTALTLVMFFCLGSEAQSTESTGYNISLSNVVERSNLVVLAEQATPRTTQEDISIVPSGEQPDPKKFPPFKRHKERFVVGEVYKGDIQLSGRTLEVDAANWGEDLELHRKYYVDHVGKSYTYESYNASKDAHEAKQKILFLRENKGTYAFTVLFAFEVESMKSEIMDLITAKK
jgi:hypothetical protein